MITEKQTPLTDEEIQEIISECNYEGVLRVWDLVKRIEAAHGIFHKVADYHDFDPTAEERN